MATGKVSTDKMVQTQIALIGDDFANYCKDNFVSFDAMIQHLMSFGDFRVFLPVVCNDRFNPSFFSLVYADNVASAQALVIMARILEQAKLFSNSLGLLAKHRTPTFGRISLDMAARLVNTKKSKTARMTASFYLPEMPIRASVTSFGRDALEREGAKHAASFNLLPIDKHYVDGMPAVVEYYLMYGKVLSIFNVHHIKRVDRTSVRSLIAALEHEDSKTAALHIRAFEEIPANQRTRMRNKLVVMGQSVYQHVKASDRKYYSAFRNGFFKAGV